MISVFENTSELNKEYEGNIEKIMIQLRGSMVLV